MRKLFSQRIREREEWIEESLRGFKGCGVEVAGKKLRKWMHGDERKSGKEPTSRGEVRKLFYERVDKSGLLPSGSHHCNNVRYWTLIGINWKKMLLYARNRTFAIAWAADNFACLR